MTTEKESLIQAIAVTAELTGTDLSKPALRIMADDLAVYPIAQVMPALTRCRRELKGRLSLAAILERLDDGRPGANEAWAMIPQDEHGSVVWTDEMSAAYGVAAPLLREGQTIPARMAFIEAYDRACQTARSNRVRTRWTPSLGWDSGQRAGAIETAVRLGRISSEHAQRLLPNETSSIIPAIGELTKRLLGASENHKT